MTQEHNIKSNQRKCLHCPCKASKEGAWTSTGHTQHKHVNDCVYVCHIHSYMVKSCQSRLGGWFILTGWGHSDLKNCSFEGGFFQFIMLKIGMWKLPHRMATSSSSQQKQVPAEQGTNAIEHLLAGKKTPRTAPAGGEKGEKRNTGSLSWQKGSQT